VQPLSTDDNVGCPRRIIDTFWGAEYNKIIEKMVETIFKEFFENGSGVQVKVNLRNLSILTL
jgi:hypothetical protein